MNKWLNLIQVIRMLNEELGRNEFTYQKMASRIRKGELKAINVSYADFPHWRIKLEWVEEFKKRLLEEHSKIPSRWKPTDDEREEAILYPLSKKLGRKITMKELRDILPELSPLQQKALTLRYGLEDDIFKSFRKVGRKMGVSRERVVQIEGSIIKFLKNREQKNEKSKI